MQQGVFNDLASLYPRLPEISDIALTFAVIATCVIVSVKTAIIHLFVGYAHPWVIVTNAAAWTAMFREVDCIGLFTWLLMMSTVIACPLPFLSAFMEVHFGLFACMGVRPFLSTWALDSLSMASNVATTVLAMWYIVAICVSEARVALLLHLTVTVMYTRLYGVALRADGGQPLLYGIIGEMNVDNPNHLFRALRDDGILTGDGTVHDAHGNRLVLACARSRNLHVLKQVLSLQFKLDVECIRTSFSYFYDEAPEIVGLMIDKAGVEVLNDTDLLINLCRADDMLRDILKRPGTFLFSGAQL
jgi:hypothetical protein